MGLTQASAIAFDAKFNFNALFTDSVFKKGSNYVPNMFVSHINKNKMNI